jgi:hypothetical protein
MTYHIKYPGRVKNHKTKLVIHYSRKPKQHLKLRRGRTMDLPLDRPFIIDPAKTKEFMEILNKPMVTDEALRRWEASAKKFKRRQRELK